MCPVEQARPLQILLTVYSHTYDLAMGYATIRLVDIPYPFTIILR